jgi:SHS2 domain-containing protein
MQIFHGFPDSPLPTESTLTIGIFDGVHCGHQLLIGRAVQAARTAHRICGVMTFHPHPVEVLAPDKPMRYLSDIETRARFIAALGVDYLCIAPFTTEVAHTLARDFVVMLLERLKMRELVIGHDFTLGYKRQGNAAFLRELGAEWGFAVQVIEPLMMGGEIVSSTRIRRLWREGRLSEVNELFGHQALTTALQASYEEVAHTADIALRVRAPSLEALFMEAARGMFALMTTQVIETESSASQTITTHADDLESLLVNWLNELLYQSEMTQQVFRVRAVNLTPSYHAQSEVCGAPIGEVRKHIKAVTFHDLAVRYDNGLFEATIVFDV